MYEMQFNKSMFSCGGEKTDKKKQLSAQEYLLSYYCVKIWF